MRVEQSQKVPSVLPLSSWYPEPALLVLCSEWVLNLFPNHAFTPSTHRGTGKWHSCIALGFYQGSGILGIQNVERHSQERVGGRWGSTSQSRQLGRPCTHAQSLQSCLTLCDPMDCSPPGSSVHAIFQARILEWVAMPSSRGSS